MRDVRRHILEVAERLFYAEGYRAVGVDRLIAEADVAKATFYRHFPTKDDLLVAVLDARDARFREWLAVRVEALAGDPRDRPLAVFDALAELFAADDFRGCAFLNTMVEVASRSHPAHEAAQRHKQRLIDYFERLLREAGVPLASALAPQILLLIDGAIVTAVREGGPGAAARARSLAENLIATARPGRRRR
ncbi:MULTISPECIES: TetR/AcrR family transcriptional regulator [Sorangium]|uniref:Transcriptional regulator, TetR family n=1 Tax=Sorangium cellulosum (strain So ce56) TaxID=448385 RepID=A9FFS4_SORC5|nr:TetR/AcrR family transcriptional regulator [Sorangium cellulosum]CAN95022.1 transcriptional regulator, TetR family [Sorangium cellulosum So ce56]